MSVTSWEHRRVLNNTSLTQKQKQTFKVTDQRNHHEAFPFFSTKEKGVFNCNDVKVLFEKIVISDMPSN